MFPLCMQYLGFGLTSPANELHTHLSLHDRKHVPAASLRLSGQFLLELDFELPG